MPQSKQVKTLTLLSKNKLPSFVDGAMEQVIPRILDNAPNPNGSEYRNQAIAKFISDFREDFFECVPASFAPDLILQIQEGIRSYIARKQPTSGAWNREEDNESMTRFTQEVFAATEFVRLQILTSVTALDLGFTVKMLRTKMFDLLPEFSRLKSLALGSGSGGVSSVFQPKFMNGLAKMKNLVNFSLTYDCNDEILEVLQKNCGTSLRNLDVEHSFQVTDAGVEFIVKCSQLENLHIFHTAITPWGHSHLLRKLKKLRRLVRGDFLCDALEVLSQECREMNEVNPVLEVEEFWASEQYFFHDEEQMELVRQMCPKIRKMMFQFSPEHVDDFLILSKFSNLQELHSWGGDFYGSKMVELVQMIGHQLKVLYLIHVDQLDSRGLSVICHSCPELHTLGFYNCIFDPIHERGTFEDLAERNRRERLGFNNWEPPKMEAMVKFAMVSDCHPKYLVDLASQMPNLRHLITGSSTEVNQATFEALLRSNCLRNVEELRVAKCSNISPAYLFEMVEQLTLLKVLRDIEYWVGLTKLDVWRFRSHVRERNLDLDCGQDFEGNEIATKDVQAVQCWSRVNARLEDL